MSSPDLFGGGLGGSYGPLDSLSASEFMSRQALQQRQMLQEMRAKEMRAMSQVRYDALASPSYQAAADACATELAEAQAKPEPKTKKSSSKVLLLCPA